MKVTLIGLGMGDQATLTWEGRQALEAADMVIGAQRLLDSLPEGVTANRRALIQPQAILDCVISQPGDGEICVVFSGDIGFYSGAKKLRPLLAAAGIETASRCGVTTAQYLAARLGISWQDLCLVSAHGGSPDVLAHVLNHEKCFFLTGGEVTPGSICRELSEAGLGETEVVVGERLSYAEEKIVRGSAAELAGREFHSLAALITQRRAPVFCWPSQCPGIPDEEFIRGRTPMTKREIRCQILSLLALKGDAVAWDVGAGTGSVSVEMALRARWGRVYAVEEDQEANGLILANRKKFGVYNLVSVEGRAPAALAELPAPQAVFIGGSKGEMKEIMAAALAKNPRARIVVSAIMLETARAAAEAMAELGVGEPELCQLAVSRAERLGQGHYLKSLNPIFLLSGGGGHD